MCLSSLIFTSLASAPKKSNVVRVLLYRECLGSLGDAHNKPTTQESHYTMRDKDKRSTSTEGSTRLEHELIRLRLHTLTIGATLMAIRIGGTAPPASER